MSIRIPVAEIKVGPRIRQPTPDRVAAMAATIKANGQDTPIDVVKTEKGFDLVDGEHRLEAIKLLDQSEIDAIIHTAKSFKSKHEQRIREIRKNMERFELNPLERAVSIAGWKESFEAINGTAKRGRKKAAANDQEEMSAKFALNFSDEAQRAFKLSRRSVFLSLKIASIDPKVRNDIAFHAIADNQSELLALADLETADQRAVCDLILSEAPGAATVAETLALIKKTPKPKKPAAWEKASQHFSKLTQKDQNRFLELHAEAIEKWLASRGQ